jgi:TRAP-type transport system small permease protein
MKRMVEVMKPESSSMNSLTKIANIFENVQTAIGGIFLFVLLSVVFLDVCFREIGTPMVWLQNIASFAFIWVVFFGAAIGLRKGSHYRIEIFPHAGPKFRKFMDLTVFTSEAIFIVVLTIYGCEFAVMSMERLVMPAGVPMFYAAVAIPLSGVFMLCYFIEVVTIWIAKKREEY